MNFEKIHSLKQLIFIWNGPGKAIFTNSSWLMLTTALTSGLGFGFWWLAARRFPPEMVGLASASISSMLLLGTLGSLGFGTYLIGELPCQSTHSRPALLTTSLLMVGTASAAFGMIFALLAPAISQEFSILDSHWTHKILFSGGVSLTAITLVLDQAFLGYLRGDLSFWRNLIFAGTKLAILVLFANIGASRSGLWIFGTWALGNALSLLALFPLGIKKFTLRDVRPDLSLVQSISREALTHHGLNIVLQIPAFVLPVIATILLSARVNACFYTAWMIANFASVAPSSFAMVLYAISSTRQGLLYQKMRLSFKGSYWICLGVCGVIGVAADPILRLFGNLYAEQAAWSLRILTLAGFPMIIRAHYVALFRIDHKIAQATRVFLACAVLELTLATLGAISLGINGLSLGWLVAVCIESLVMFKKLPIFQEPH